MGLRRVQDGLQLLHWQPAPQSRIMSSAQSVGKSENSHDTVCLLIENDEQMAIACVGMADVNIQITLGISGEV